VDSGHRGEELTLLITLLFDWIEESQQANLYYGNIYLRGAMERYFYFDAMVHPERLLPVLDVCKEWRYQNNSSEHIAIYDRYYSLANQRSSCKKIYDEVFSWLRIMSDYYFHFKSRCRPRAKNMEGRGKRKIGFFTISQRFIHFFQDIEQRFDLEENVYFSSAANSTSIAKDMARNSIFAVDESFKLMFSEFFISPSHKLFPVYFRLCFFYQRISATLHYWKPDVLLFAEGTSHYDELAALSASQLNIPTVRLQSGRAATLHSGYRNMPFDTMLCWGDAFIDRYRSVSPKAMHIACGSPLMDEVANSEPTNNHNSKNLIIFTQPVAMEIISEQDYLILVQLVEYLIKHTNKINILIRMHPIDKNTAFYELARANEQRIKIVNSPEFSLANIMNMGECAIAFASTTLSEAAACGVIPIILKTSNQHSYFPYPENHGAAIVVESLDTAIERIVEVMTNPDKFVEMRRNMQQFSYQFFGPSDGGSVNRVVKLVRDIANNKETDG